MPTAQNPVNGESRDGVADGIDELRLARAIIQLTRELKASVPPARTAPFFGLDHDIAYDLRVLESLSARGIFRKYELVLLIRSGFGGVARWLSRRLGCRILGVDESTARTRAANKLNDEAAICDVEFVAGAYDRLPFRDRIFTHVWLVDPPPLLRSQHVLSEAFRVLRSGADLAMQLSGSSSDDLARTQQVLHASGFDDFDTQAVELSPRGHREGLARARLRGILERDALRCLPGETSNPPRGYQIFCRRP